MVRDTFVDTAPSGYNKDSANPKRPGFKQNALMLYAWIAGLATNALLDFAEQLPSNWRRRHPRTLRRWFFETPAQLYLGKDTLIVALNPGHMLPVWRELIERVNHAALRIPWLDNPRLVLSLDTAAAQTMRKLDMIHI